MAVTIAVTTNVKSENFPPFSTVDPDNCSSLVKPVLEHLPVFLDKGGHALNCILRLEGPSRGVGYDPHPLMLSRNSRSSGKSASSFSDRS
jgi:hypothetical protein